MMNSPRGAGESLHRAESLQMFRRAPRLCYRGSGMLRLLTALLLASVSAFAQTPNDPDRWEPDMQAFEKKDKENPPAKGGIVFLGSSSIRRWDLPKYFPDLPLVNRGFGGSVIADSIRYFDRIVTPLQPKTVVLYAGDNDIGRGMTAQEVFSEYKRFVATARGSLPPEAKIVFIAIKPSIRRRAMLLTVSGANHLIMEYAQRDPMLEFVDIATPMLDDDGEPRTALYVEDGLHLSPEGEKLWAGILRPYLK